MVNQAENNDYSNEELRASTIYMSVVQSQNLTTSQDNSRRDRKIMNEYND